MDKIIYYKLVKIDLYIITGGIFIRFEAEQNIDGSGSVHDRLLGSRYDFDTYEEVYEQAEALNIEYGQTA